MLKKKVISANSLLITYGPPKKCLVSGNPTDPTFLGPTLNFLGTSENFSSIFSLLNDFHAFSYTKNFPNKKLPYLMTLKNIETFPETRHLFFFWPMIFEYVNLFQILRLNC